MAHASSFAPDVTNGYPFAYESVAVDPKTLRFGLERALFMVLSV